MSLNLGNMFQFPLGNLVNNAIYKRDKRFKLVKSPYPTYNTNRTSNMNINRFGNKTNNIIKAQNGSKLKDNLRPQEDNSKAFKTLVSNTEDTSLLNVPSYLLNSERQNQQIKYNPDNGSKSMEDIKAEIISPITEGSFKTTSASSNSKPQKPTNYSKYSGYENFQTLYDEVEKEMPQAKQYRNLLTKICAHESRFNPGVQNTAGAPAYGYFQFWEEPGKLTNITHYTGMAVEDFLGNPKEQIKAAVKMAKAIDSQLTKKDLEQAAAMNVTRSGLIGGAWLGGLRGVRQVLNGTGDPSDAKWYNGKSQGSKVSECLQRYNNL